MCGGGPRPTEGAPTPRNADGQAPAGRGERGPADLSPVARAAEVSAENGHSLGRRGEGGRLGHPKGRKSRRGNTGTHFTETGTQETGSIRTAHLQTAHAINTAQTQHTAQVLFFFPFFESHRMQNHNANAIHSTQIHTTWPSRPAKPQQRQRTVTHV